MTEREMIEKFLRWLTRQADGGASVVRIEDARRHFAGSRAASRVLARRPS